MNTKLRCGTRNSKLALIQAQYVKDQLESQTPGLCVELVPMTTIGDENKDKPLHELGGKGAFITTLEQALITNEIDIAVHSLKDMTSLHHPQMDIVAYLKPEARSDCFVFANKGQVASFDQLPQGMTCATSSLRRKLILNHIRPDITIIDIRGNIETRIKKIQAGLADAVMLSTAGLHRISQAGSIGLECDPSQIIPAPGQGVIVVQARSSMKEYTLLFEAINDPETCQMAELEQALVSRVGLGCNYPLGVYVTQCQNGFDMQVCWSDMMCSEYYSDNCQGSLSHMNDYIEDVSSRISKVLHKK